jgi:hypothetical protein
MDKMAKEVSLEGEEILQMSVKELSCVSVIAKVEEAAFPTGRRG